MKMEKVTRVVLIAQGKGIIYENRDLEEVEVFLQDDDRTLKVFIKERLL